MEGGAEVVRADERLQIYHAETWRCVGWHAWHDISAQQQAVKGCLSQLDSAEDGAEDGAEDQAAAAKWLNISFLFLILFVFAI
jgi:hypothetical protein